MEHATDIDMSGLAVEKCFIALKAEVDKLDIDKLTNVPTSLNDLKTKVDDLDVVKLKVVPLDLKILIVDNEVLKYTRFKSDLVITTVLNTKISEVENKIPDNFKYITTQECNKLTAESFEARLNQGDLVKKTDFDNKLASSNRRITSNKTKHLEIQKKLNGIITRDYKFFLGRIYFTNNDGSQNTFVYQPTLDALELKQDRGADYGLSWKSKGV